VKKQGSEVRLTLKGREGTTPTKDHILIHEIISNKEKSRGKGQGGHFLRGR
jgi:hypothetical protein